MSGRKSRTKGRAFEQELVRWFKSHGFDARRGYQSRGGGTEQADVIVSELPELHVEAKRPARSAVYAYVDQAVKDSGDCRNWAVLLRADGRSTLAIVPADDWLELVKEAE